MFFMPSCWQRYSINLDVNSDPISECSILGNPNFNMIPKNKCVTTVIVFLSSMGLS